MTRRARKILFFLAIFLFALATPPVLLYAAGWSFDLEQGKVVLTGGLYLKSIPEEATVLIMGAEKTRTPAFIRHLAPKEYFIEVTKAGYQPWYKTLKVKSQLVAEAKNILLVPIQPEISLREPDSFKPAPNNSPFYLQKPSNLLYRQQTDRPHEQISTTPLPASPAGGPASPAGGPEAEYQIFTSSRQTVAALSSQGDLYLFNVQTKNFELLDRHAQRVQFTDDGKKMLYFTPSELWIYVDGQKELITRLSKEIKAACWYGPTNEHIVFAADGKILLTELDSREPRNTFQIAEASPDEILYSSEEKLIYFTENNRLFSVSIK